TRQEPSRVMPTFTSGDEPVNVQVNLVPLYLPATISPGPTHLPSTDWKNCLSRSPAEAVAGRIAVAEMARASGSMEDTITLFIEDTRQRNTERNLVRTMNMNG